MRDFLLVLCYNIFIMLPFDRNGQREQVGLRYIETTQEVFARPEIQDALGEQADAIVDRLSTSFVAPYRNGAIRLPEDQLDTTNLAIHPQLWLEHFHDRNENEWLLPDDRDWFKSQSAHDYDGMVQAGEAEVRHMGLLGKPIANAGALHISSSMAMESDDGSTRVITSRSLITIGRIRQSKSPLDIANTAAITGHEVDHSVKALQEMYGVDYAKFMELRGNEQLVRRQMTRWERSAYNVAYQVVSMAGVSGPTVEEVASLLDTSTPVTAARSIERLESKVLTPPERTRFFSAGALALSHIFGDRSAGVTPGEVAAYLRAGFIQ